MNNTNEPQMKYRLENPVAIASVTIDSHTSLPFLRKKTRPKLSTKCNKKHVIPHTAFCFTL